MPNFGENKDYDRKCLNLYNLDGNKENTIKKSINNLVNDEKYADLLWNSIINFSSSLYGILAALTPNSKWEDVIVDKDKFNSFIKELSTSNK